MKQNIIEKEYVKEMKQSFIDYSMATITDRALPDVRDGFKPVHRRVLYGMKALGIASDKPHKKSARIVGDVMGKYHPHGDSSIYEAMVRLAQDFSMGVPLVDGHGNFGSVDGDPAAAMRYTEARLSQTSEFLMEDLEKGVVDFVPNYDESEIEPAVLPARFPNLLINGIEGIATGMKTSIPTHNPTEVMDAVLYCLKTANPTLEGILEHISAPDYPMGGVIINEEEVKKFYTTGYGNVLMRGRYHIEDGTYGKKMIVFTELPKKSIGSKTKLLNSLINLANDKVLEEASDIRDESSREGIRLVIEVRKGTDIDDFMNKLWLKSKLQDSEGVQFLVLVDGAPKTITLDEYFRIYVAFQHELMGKRHAYLIEKNSARLEIVEGLLKAHDEIDAVIEAIRGAKTLADAKACLTAGDTTKIEFRMKKNESIAKKFDFTDAQAQSILEMRLQKLIGLEQNKLMKEKTALEKEIANSQEILANPKRMQKELIKDAENVKKLFGRERKTEVTTASTRKILRKKIVTPVTVMVDRFGYVKYANDHDAATEATTVFHANTNTDDKVAVFTNKGNLYQLKMKDVPVANKKERGKPIQVLVGMDADELPVFTTLSSILVEQKAHWVFVTKEGSAKVVSGKEFETARAKLAGTVLKENDELFQIVPYNAKDEYLFLTSHERAMRLPMKSYLKVLKKNSAGYQLARLDKDEIIEMGLVVGDQTEVEFHGKTVAIAAIGLGTTTRAPKNI